MKKYLLPIVMLLALGAGCAPQSNNYPIAPEPGTSTTGTVAVPETTTITYYVSPKPNDRDTFCDGSKMDSAGYKNSLTKQTTLIAPGKLSLEEKIKFTLKLAAENSGDFDDTYTRIPSTTFNGGVVTMRPAGGWAGVSIFMCAWQPFAEKNLEQFTEVKKVEWVPET